MIDNLKIIHDFIKTIGLEELIFKNSKQMTMNNGKIQNHDKRMLLVDSHDCVKIYIQVFSDFGYDEPENAMYHYAEAHYNNDIFYFRRNIFAPGEDVFGEDVDGYLKDTLEKNLIFNEKSYKRYYFSKDFVYINEDTVENEYVKLSDFEQLLRIKCTKMGSVYVPSNRAQRYFLIMPGFVFTEDLKQPVKYHARNTPDLTYEDVLVVASMRRSTARDWTILKNEYSETITKKLLKL